MARTTKAKSLSYLRWLLLLPVPALWCVLGHFGYLQFLENRLLDLRFRYRGEIEAPVKLIYVDVDTPAIELMGERPWSRSLYANVAEALLEVGGAKAIGFDFVLSKISRSGLVDLAKARDGNVALRKVILAHPKSIVLAAQYTPGAAVTQAEGTLREVPLLRKGKVDRSKNDVPEMPENGFVIGPQASPVARVGLIDVDVEYSGDEVPRWVPLFVHTIGPTLYHMSLQLVLQYYGLDEKAVRIGKDRLDVLLADGTPAVTIPLCEGQLLEANWFSRWENPALNPRHSLAEIINAMGAYSSDDAEQRTLARKIFAEFKDAIVLIGPTDILLQDLAPTPFDSHPVPRVGLHGNLLKTILAEKFLYRVPSWGMWLAAFGLTVLVSALAVAGGARGLLAKVVALIALAGYTYISFYLFAHSHIVLPMAAPLGAAFTTSFGAIIWQLVEEEKQKGRIKGMFGAYVSPQLVNRMVESGDDPQLGGHDAEITAYFSDIQSFSTFSEKLGSGPLVELMNEYLTACTDIVQEEGGTLDKYIGDAVVAMFGAPIPLSDHALRACVATQRVHLKLGELRAKWTTEGGKWPEVVCKMQSRIGLNSGVCMIGNMGSRTRFNYTMMGDNVNLAARMESGAKQWGAYTMCTELTRVACVAHGGDRVVFRPLGRIVVKGRTQAVPIHEIVGLKENVTQPIHECIGLFAEGLARYYARDWAGALALFARSKLLEPNIPGQTPGVVSNPSLTYLDITAHYQHEPPPENWDGVYVMKEK
jgi:adenylate cyclase